MKRRDFLAQAGASALMPISAASAETIMYRPGVVADLLAAGKTVFVDFYTDWCVTCRAQGRAIEKLRADNPQYDASMVFVKVNWDVYEHSALSVDYDIPRRSTLLLLRGNQELGRIVADANPAAIKALMDKGLVSA
jgi:thioredoxin 1